MDVEYGHSFDGGALKWAITEEGVKRNLAIAQNTLGVLLIIELVMKWILDFRVLKHK